MEYGQRVSREEAEESSNDDDIILNVIPINWWDLKGEDAGDRLNHLNKFVLQLVRMYVLPEQVVPRCWYLHNALIQELFALYQLRDQVHYNVTGGAHGPFQFHTELQLAIHRMRGWVTLSGCNGAEHFGDFERLPDWVRPEESTSDVDTARSRSRKNFTEYVNQQFNYVTTDDDDEYQNASY